MNRSSVGEDLGDQINFAGKAAFVVLIVVGAALLFTHVGNYYLWGDEGETALLGKSVLMRGLPYGFDGRNLYEFRNGLCLNSEFLPVLTPWLQFYWAASSMALFGADTFGARAMFVCAGLLAMIVQFLFVLRYFRNSRIALFSFALIVTSVPMLLFIRQCRYYALVMLLSGAVAFLYSRYEGKWQQLLAAGLLFLLFFFANPLLAIPALAAMAVSFFLFDDRRRAVTFFLLPLPAVLSIMGLFYFRLHQGGWPDRPEILANIHPRDFSRIAWLYFRDFNLTQLLPLGLVVMLVLLWIKDATRAGGDDRRQMRREWSVASIIVVFTVILSVLSPQYSGASHSDIRYSTPIFPFLLLLCALAVERFYRWRKRLAYVLLPVLIFTNLLTFSPLRFYLHEYVQELYAPSDNSVKTAVRFLDRLITQDEVILVSPNDMIGPMEFYLGRKLLFCDVIGAENRNLLQAGVKLPPYTYSVETVPDWIVLFGLSLDVPHAYRHLAGLELRDYEKYLLPVFGPDVSRPELFWRSFRPVRSFQPDQALIVLRHIRRSG